MFSGVPKYSNNKETSDSQVEVSEPSVSEPRPSVSEPRPMSTVKERSSNKKIIFFYQI